jgi:hypothetical protein
MAINAVRLVALALVLAMLTSPTDLSSCGPFLLNAVFTFSRQPDHPETGLAQGQPGILLPSFYRSHLIVAYLRLIGLNLNDAERNAFYPPAPKPGTDAAWIPGWSVSLPPAAQAWLEARKKVPGAPEPTKIDVYRRQRAPNTFAEYVNCADDALGTAVTTLDARLAKFGAGSPELKEWLSGQDDVFANCSGALTIPKQAAAASSALLLADRSYQIAAANFYAGDLDEAESQFRAIAADASSPWRATSAYLLARCSIRRATLGDKPEAMEQAQAQLESILKDDALKPMQPAAASLLNYVRARLDPDLRLHELSQAILSRAPNLAQNFIDYQFLFYKLDGTFKQPDDLTEWLATFRNVAVPDDAVERWRATQSLPWLVAALTQVHTANGSVPELLEAADKVKAESPGYATVAFHSIRLLEESQQADQARRRLDVLLAARRNYPPSTVNLLLAERMRVAESWAAFLKYAPRVPVGSGYDYDGENSSDISSDPQLKAFAGRPVLDLDAANVFNQQIPLHLWVAAAENGSLPASLRSDIAITAWARAVLFDDNTLGDRLARDLQKLRPEWKQALSEYIEARDKPVKRFAAIYFMLHNPGIGPTLASGFGRLTAIGKIDSFRDNWWCGVTPTKGNPPAGQAALDSTFGYGLRLLYGTAHPDAAFLAPADRSQAEGEFEKLASLSSAPTLLSTQTIEYVRAHPDDPRAPEALALAVRSTRYGCGDAGTGKQSEAAFRLLHQRYAASEWAKRTKYWYR